MSDTHYGLRLFNGEQIDGPGATAQLVQQLASDRGLQYGDGVFRTFPIVQGQALHLEQQLELLAHDAGRLDISAPVAALNEEVPAIASEVEEGVIKIILSRGSSARGYGIAKGSSSNRLVYLNALPNNITARRTQGVALIACNTRLGSNPQLAGIKHLNRLEQVLARAELPYESSDEGLLLDAEQRPISGTQANLFIVKGGRINTASLKENGVAGFMRSQVLQTAAAAHIPCYEQALVLDDLETADEIFLSNSVVGIWPVTFFDQRSLAIGTITQTLQSTLNHPVST